MLLKSFLKKSNLNLKDEIWILSDDRPGTFSQSVGLAEKIGLEYRLIELKYNFLAKLPNVFFSNSLIRLKHHSKTTITDSSYLPRLIISSGRRSATIGLYIKKLSNNKTSLIQIMNPDLNFNKFDLVVLPKHDGVDESKFTNLITTIGSLTKIDEKIIAAESEKFALWFSDINKTKIALLIGGSSNKTIFDERSAKKLATMSSKVANNMNAKLLVLTSRRTEEKVANIILENLECDFQFFDWQTHQKENPYLAVLGYSDFFIVSGDSVSMISECCSTGKPVYIFDNNELSAMKHRKFHRDLILEKYAKNFEERQKKLIDFFPNKLEETKRVASFIRQNILVE